MHPVVVVLEVQVCSRVAKGPAGNPPVVPMTNPVSLQSEQNPKMHEKTVTCSSHFHSFENFAQKQGF